MNRFFRLSTLALAAGTMLAAGSAYAANTDTMTVSGAVTNVCDVTASAFTFTSTPSNIAGDWDHTDATAFAVTCTSGASYSIGIDPGANQVTLDTSDRRMTDGTNFLQYKLYSDAHTTEVVPNSTTTNYGTGLTGSGSAQDYDLAARVLQAEVNATPAGTYTDTVTVTITLN